MGATRLCPAGKERQHKSSYHSCQQLRWQTAAVLGWGGGNSSSRSDSRATSQEPTAATSPAAALGQGGNTAAAAGAAAAPPHPEPRHLRLLLKQPLVHKLELAAGAALHASRRAVADAWVKEAAGGGAGGRAGQVWLENQRLDMRASGPPGIQVRRLHFYSSLHSLRRPPAVSLAMWAQHGCGGHGLGWQGRRHATTLAAAGRPTARQPAPDRPPASSSSSSSVSSAPCILLSFILPLSRRCGLRRGRRKACRWPGA